MILRSLRGAFALSFSCVFLPLPVYAENTSNAADNSATGNIADTDAMIVIGQHDAPISIAPRGLSVSLGDAEFAGVNATAVEDLIKYAPDFFVRSRYIGDNNGVPGFRGTHSSQSARSLVMVDGFVVSNFLGNSFSYPPAWGLVGPGEVKQFDIVYGPYSSRYPGNSMGGIINITTRAPERTEAFATLQGFSQPYKQYGTHDRLWGGSVEGGFALKQKDGPLSLRISVRRLKNRAQPMQYYQLTPYSGSQTPTVVTGAVSDPALITKQPIFGDYSPITLTQDQLRAQIGFDRGEFKALAMLTYWWNSEYTLHPNSYLKDASGNTVYGGSAASPAIVRLGGVNYSAIGSNQGVAHKNEWLAGLKLEGPVAGFNVRLNLSTLQFARQDSRTSNGYAAGLADGAGIWTNQGSTGWYTADLLATRDFGAHSLAFGINANDYFTSQGNYNTTNWREAAGQSLISNPFGKTRMVGIFAEDEISLSETASITAGVRSDFWRAFGGGLSTTASSGILAGRIVSQNYDNRSEHAVNPTLSGKWEFLPGWHAELSLATASRFPTVGELFQGSLNGDGSFNPNSFNPDLKTEQSRDANLLLRHRLGRVTVTGSLFYQRVRNAIFSYSGFNQNGVINSAYKNIDLTRQYGAELIGEAKGWPIRGLDIDANIAWIDARTTGNAADPASVGVRFPRIPEWRMGGNLRYAVSENLQTVLGFRYASRPNTDLDGLYRGDTYGYTSELFALDTKINWQATDNLRFSAGVNNITNDRAWVYHPYPERTFFLETGWKL